MTYDVFISYSRRDTELADRVVAALESRGARCFIDRDSIELSDDFAEKISRAIYECEVLLFIWTESSNQSENTANEVALAKMYRKKIIPFMVGDFIPHYKLAYHLVRNNRADRGQGFTADKLDGLAEEVVRTVDTARRERMHDEQTARTEERNRAEAETLAQRMDEHRAGRSDDQRSAPAAGADDPRYEDDYALGRDLFRRYRLDEAFGMLIEPALAGYKDAQTLLYYCICTPTRCYKIRGERFERLRPQAEAGDGFALYLLSVYSDFRLDDPAAAFDFAERSANAGSEFGKLQYAGCFEFGTGVEVDNERAVAQLRRLALAGNPHAKRRMGCHLTYGWICDAYPELGVRMLREAAEAGEIRSLNDIGALYQWGKHVEKDDTAATEYYNRAVEAGWVEAYDSLGTICGYDDNGNVKDIRRGLEFYTKGAELSEPSCMESIGIIYENGLNGRVNMAAAIKWYKRAAEAGSRFSYLFLGNTYYYGRDGIPEDNAEAWRYFETGATRFRSWDCYYMLGRMCLAGHAPAGHERAEAVGYFEKTVFGGSSYAGSAALALYEMFHNGATVARDERRGIGYLEKAAGYDNTDALLKLGEVLTSDLDSPYSDEIKGMRCLQRACDKGSDEAAIALAELYRQGIATIRDTDKAKELLQLAIDRGSNPQAMCEMGKLFSHASQAGWDEEHDDTLSAEQRSADNDIAMTYFRLAAEQDYPEAYSRMAEIAIERSSGSDASDNEASQWKSDFFEWSRKGAELDYPQSVLDMGVAYHLGVGVAQDTDKAEEWYRKACDMGQKTAPASLASLYMDERPDLMTEAYRLLTVARERGAATDEYMKQFDERLHELARQIETSPEGFDTERFVRQVLPAKLDCTADEADGRMQSDTCPDTSQLVKAYAECRQAVHWLADAPKLSELDAPGFERQFERYAFVDPLRRDIATLWGYLRTAVPKLRDLSFFEQEKILDVAEFDVTDENMQMTIVACVELHFELYRFFDALRKEQK